MMVLFPELPQTPITDQLLLGFVPQPIIEGFKAGKEGDGFYLLEQRVGLVTFLQIVVGNARTQMVNMMKADVAGEPLEDAGQLIK